MQLNKIDSSGIAQPGEFIYRGKVLAGYIDNPPDNKLVFSDYLSDHRNSTLFPRLNEAFNDLKKPLKKQSTEERKYLKGKLWEDVKANIADASAQFEADKLLESEVLPSDPNACMECLEKMEHDVHDQIRELNVKLVSIGRAMANVEFIQKRKRELEAYDESIFTSIPSDIAEPPNKKKPKNTPGC